MKNQNNGITLIALVITVIVLLILAGTAISIALSGDNIFTKANTAVNAANAKAIEQTDNILALEGNFDVYYSSYNPSQAPGESALPAGWSSTYVASAYPSASDAQKAPIPVGFKASIYNDAIANETTIAGGLVIYKTDGAELDPSAHETAMTTYDQYVWIPVTDPSTWTDSYSSTEPVKLSGISDYRESDALLTSMSADYEAMKTSVTTYGGFYISRYELGGTTSIPTSRKGQTVLNASSTWYGLYNAAHIIKNLAGTIDLESVGAHMIFGCEYDKVISFIGTKAAETHSGRVPTTLQQSGQTQDIMNNIYDLEGNLLEGTAQAAATYYRVKRGGNYGSANNSHFDPASNRSSDVPTVSDSSLGVRQALYVK